MKIYIDKEGNAIKLGDILKYEDNLGCGCSLDEVIQIDGADDLYGVARMWGDTGEQTEDPTPVRLDMYRDTPKDTSAPCDAIVIGNVTDNPEMLTAEYAAKLWPNE